MSGLEKERNKTIKLERIEVKPYPKSEFKPIETDPVTPDYAERHIEGSKTYQAELKTSGEFPIPSEAKNRFSFDLTNLLDEKTLRENKKNINAKSGL